MYEKMFRGKLNKYYGMIRRLARAGKDLADSHMKGFEVKTCGEYKALLKQQVALISNIRGLIDKLDDNFDEVCDGFYSLLQYRGYDVDDEEDIVVKGFADIPANVGSDK